MVKIGFLEYEGAFPYSLSLQDIIEQHRLALIAEYRNPYLTPKVLIYRDWQRESAKDWNGSNYQKPGSVVMGER